MQSSSGVWQDVSTCSCGSQLILPNGYSCKETEMGYLNRILLTDVLYRNGSVYDRNRTRHGRTLHPFYTALFRELLWQPPPNQETPGFFCRNFFENNMSQTYDNFFGVHFAGGVKPWTNPESQKLFGAKQPQFKMLLAKWLLAANKGVSNNGFENSQTPVKTIRNSVGADDVARHPDTGGGLGESVGPKLRLQYSRDN